MLSGLHPAAPPLSAVRRLTAALLLVGAVAHLGFLAQLVVDTALSPWHTLPSQLAAVGQPSGVVFRVADGIAGGAFVLASPPLLRLAPVHWLGRLTVGLVFAFGVILLLRAAVPTECVPAPPGLCGEPTGLSRTVGLSVGLQYLVGPAVVTAWWHSRWRIAAGSVLLVQFTALTVVASAGMTDGQFLGLAVRVQAVGASVLFVLGAAYVLTMGAVRPPARQRPPRERSASCPG
ncbi:hypothetical protein B1813_18070 [Saccharomonospora piscinae]|uniref:DUF998 domain-containing protein n=1 Tax=Saccharomonospora piscinae TaxID=687388 RepID=A0A1V8ZZW2_SACPI|nr:DUF998 domain-containing protein [Saccharomonospora piscinae]OQO90326.1 hypothetical protein B1813_18070 [Saccharomonospora piscinae]TLW89743.1 DUF998 domain-containing protein [Saccharomonospora piscinae]